MKKIGKNPFTYISLLALVACVALIALALPSHPVQNFSKAAPAIPSPTPTIGACEIALDPKKAVFGVALPMGTHGGPPYPGVYNQTYYYPTSANYKFYADRGVRLIRFSYNWERWQRSLYAPLDATEMARVDASIAEANKLGIKVVLDPHNFARYYASDKTYWMGGGANFAYTPLPLDAYTDFMRKVAQHFVNNKTIYAYSLMNEPVNTQGVWNSKAAQLGVNAIRYNADGSKLDWNHIIHVPGDGWSNIHGWQQNNANLNIVDPANKFAYDGHIYFNHNMGNVNGYLTPYPSIYPSARDPYTDPSQVGPGLLSYWVSWLASKNAPGFISEFGFPDNDQGYAGITASGLNYNLEYSTDKSAPDYNAWLTVMDSTLSYLKQHNIGGLLWLGDAGSSRDNENLEPRTIGPSQFIGMDKPMTPILQKYLNSSCITQYAQLPSSVTLAPPLTFPTKIPTITPTPTPAPITYYIKASITCPVGYVSGTASLYYSVWPPNPLTWKTIAIGKGTYDVAISSTKYENNIYVGVTAANGTNMSPIGTPPHSKISYTTYFNPPTMMAKWSREVPGGNYTIKFAPPAGWCTPGSALNGTTLNKVTPTTGTSAPRLPSN